MTATVAPPEKAGSDGTKANQTTATRLRNHCQYSRNWPRRSSTQM